MGGGESGGSQLGRTVSAGDVVPHTRVSVCDCARGLGSGRGCRVHGVCAPGGDSEVGERHSLSGLLRRARPRGPRGRPPSRTEPGPDGGRSDQTPPLGASSEVEGHSLGPCPPSARRTAQGGAPSHPKKQRQAQPTRAPNGTQQLTNLYIFLTSRSCHGYPHAWFPGPGGKPGGVEQALSPRPSMRGRGRVAPSVGGGRRGPTGCPGPWLCAVPGRSREERETDPSPTRE